MIAPVAKSDGKPLQNVKDISRDAYIIAHKEDTQHLEIFFRQRGLQLRVLRLYWRLAPFDPRFLRLPSAGSTEEGR